MKVAYLLSGMLFIAPNIALAQQGWQPSAPGRAKFVQGKDGVILENRALSVRFTTAGGLRFSNLLSKWNPTVDASLGEAFRIEYGEGDSVAASKLAIVSPLSFVPMPQGATLQATLRDPKHGLEIRWEVVLLNDSHYFREEVTLKPTSGELNVTRLVFGEGGHGQVAGTVPGSPVTFGSGHYFAGIEHPMAEASSEPVTETKSWSISTPASGQEIHRARTVVTDGKWSTAIRRKIPIRSGQSVTYSAVYGVAPEGQMRRAFLSYLERERPRKYEPFLHYNSWYDLGYFNKYTADECVQRINTFGQELAVKRNVPLKSFLFDDGWDDTSTIWEFHAGFPKGFTPLKDAAAKYGAAPGIWLSPWGGYGGPRQQRLVAGKKEAMEIDSQGYALSGPKYYDRFHQVCLDLVGKYGINQFKFDGTGSPDKQYPGSQFSSDFEAAISLIRDLRVAKPGLFINLTTGTWPSPFWTRYADSIWRGGSDHSFAGVGPKREQWITYRDGDTYHGVVQRGPLYPLTSLMLHGLIYAQYANGLKDDPTGAFRHELRSYFGNGTQLQEMYITPSLLSKDNWDDLAQCAKWNWANRDTLVDTHWVGGDPNNLEVYGWASWSPKNAILTLRNPSDHAQAFSIEPQRVFELPPNVKGRWAARSPYDFRDGLEIGTQDAKVIVLQPFEVRVLQGAIK